MSREQRRCTRQERATTWAVTHAGELAGVGAPLIAGVVWTPWLHVVSLAAAGMWAANEMRLRHTTRTARQAATVTAAPARRELSTTTATQTQPSEKTGRKEAKA